MYSQEFQDKLSYIENLTKIDEYKIASTFHELQNDLVSPEEQMAILAESMAFDFVEDYPKNDSSWGTYFGPMSVFPVENGFVERPSIKKVTPEIIEYWEKRANESNNPILKARYAGLVWDFSKAVVGNNAKFDIGRLYAENLIEIAIQNLSDSEISTITKLERAVQVSTGLNAKDLIQKVKEAIIQYEDIVAIDDKPGLWGMSFDYLLENNKIKLEPEEEDKIINDLEGRLIRNSENEDLSLIDPMGTEAAAVRLARYYRKKGLSAEYKRVLLQVGKAYDATLDKGTGLQVNAWLEHLFRLYNQFQLHEDAKKVLLKLRERSSKVRDDLSPVSHTFEYPVDRIEEFTNDIVSGDIFKEVIPKIALYFVPKKQQAEELVLELAKKYPFQFLISEKIIDKKGRVVATVGSIQDDLQGRVVRQINNQLSISSVLLNFVFEKFIDKYQIDETVIVDNFLYSSPVFDVSRINLIRRGINAYLNQDYVVSIHILVPQIEEAIRNLIEMCHGQVLKPSKGGDGFHLKTFDDILRDKILEEVFDEDFSLYLRVLFTDQRGWNLRNDLCHGMLSDTSFSKNIADRVFHTILCLGLVKKEEK